ncbi:MAG: MAPEG family protein [Gammaproteobacteria bacterium]
MLTEKQQGVLCGMVTGLVATVLALGLAILIAPAALIPQQGYPATLAHALQWDVLLVICLAANIALLARHRFFTPEDIDGGGLTRGTPQAQVLQATLQNTLEQAVLGLAIHLIWAATMPQSWQAAVPVAAIFFFIGRILFWRGYARGAPARALGFTLTFYPSVVMFVLILGRLIWGFFS